MSKILTVAGFSFLIIGLIMSGVLGSGYQTRASYSDEPLNQKMKRMNWSAVSVIIGLILLGIGYFLSK